MNQTARFRTAGILALALAVLSAALLKIWILRLGLVSFNSDEAIVALMARHINQGARPLFFYGQAYLGSLDAWLIALAFRWFGQEVWVIRLVQGGLYLGTILTAAWLGRLAFGSWVVGILAAWLLAIPAVNTTLYTTATLGGYGEALLLGNLILILTLVITGSAARKAARSGSISVSGFWLLWGLLAGFGFWVFGLTLVYSIPAGITLIRSAVRSQGRSAAAVLFLAGVGFLLGSAPWWMGAMQLGLGRLTAELGGSAIAGVEPGNLLSRIGTHALSFLLLGTTVISGLRPPWGVQWLAFPLGVVALVFGLLVIGYTIRSLRRRDHPHRDGIKLLVLVAVTLIAGFILTPFGADPSGRYFLPLVVPLSLLGAAALVELWTDHRLRAGLLFGLLLVFHFLATLEVLRRADPGFTTQFYPPSQLDRRHDEVLIAFLLEQGATCGYSNYWVSYPLAFLSEERLVYVPALPYHPDFRYTSRDNRYAPYNQVVGDCQRPAYITTHHPALDQRLRRGLMDRGVTWQERRIGDYLIFYDLSERVEPDDIGIFE